ncbi:MAG: erythromycin biosynthesis sensory transduction protein EryC1 [Rhodospirillales bacterium]|nr:erythromycin biosynthesis sensory transduction protein EryC1 [Rhodospirillales bacterium]
MTASVPQNDPKAAYLAQRPAIDAAIARVLASGWYILGDETSSFEAEFAAAMGCRHGIGVGNGTDALILALRALGIGAGQSVATVSHTAVATVAAIETAGARPLLIDIDPATYTMDPQALEQALAAPPPGGAGIAAILPVHLYGQAADLTPLCRLAQRYRIPLIEDCAQAHGASFEGRPVGSFGDIACFSFYPTKNLGALGDGGALTTSDDRLAAEIRAIREYGWRGSRYVSERTGVNSRLDELQAAILRAKLGHLAADNDRRSAIASRYDAGLAGLDLALPSRGPGRSHVFHQYVVRSRRRDALRESLQEAGIGTNIHYPVPIHLQPAYRDRLASGPSGLAQTERAAGEILSLPMFPQLSDAQIERTIAALRAALA